MKFTGERFIPGYDDPQLFQEHLHRYLFAVELVGSRTVLDVGCGEGYGTFLLARSGAFAVGLEWDGESVEHAQRRYGHGSVQFVRARGQELPFVSGAFDAVVALEFIEHVSQQEEALAEMARALTHRGVLVISTPNREVYSDQAGYKNPYHVREFYEGEFRDLLRRFFPSVQLYGQRNLPGSLIWPFDGRDHARDLYTRSSQRQDLEENARPSQATYFLAVCRKEPVKSGDATRASALLDVSEGMFDILREEVGRRDDTVRRLQDELKEKTNWAHDLEQAVRDRDGAIEDLHKEMEEKNRWALDLQGENDRVNALVSELRAQEGKLRQEIEEKNRWALGLDVEIRDRDRSIRALQVEVEHLAAELNDLRRRVAYRVLRRLHLVD